MARFISIYAITKDDSAINIDHLTTQDTKYDGYTTEILIDITKIPKETIKIKVEFDESSRSDDT